MASHLTPRKFRRIRESLELTAAEWAEALGYEGAKTSNTSAIYALETGRRPIPLRVERLAIMYDKYGVPDDWL